MPTVQRQRSITAEQPDLFSTPKNKLTLDCQTRLSNTSKMFTMRLPLICLRQRLTMPPLMKTQEGRLMAPEQ